MLSPLFESKLNFVKWEISEPQRKNWLNDCDEETFYFVHIKIKMIFIDIFLTLLEYCM